MTKRRDPVTVPGAVLRILGALTAEHAAEILNKSPRQVRRFADDGDDGTAVTVADAIRLDAAYVNAALGPAPIHTVYDRQLAARTQGHAERRLAGVLMEFLDVDVAVGDLADAIRRTIAPGSPGGKKMTPNEALVLISVAEKLRGEIDEVIESARIEANLNDSEGG